VPRKLIYVPVDFRSDVIGTALGAAGYDPARRAFFIWEGVTMYLPETAIEETLRWVGKQAAGSAIVFDFVYRAVIDFMRSMQTDHLPEAAQQAMERVRKLEAGEPWLFGIPAGTEREFLKKFGLTLRELLPIGGEESRKLYLTRSHGSF
jgi:methyltransferase (TIGR00027 family)